MLRDLPIVCKQGLIQMVYDSIQKCNAIPHVHNSILLFSLMKKAVVKKIKYLVSNRPSFFNEHFYNESSKYVMIIK